MKSVHGIAITDNDQYTLVTLTGKERSWRFSRSRSWSTTSKTGAFRLFVKGVTLGIPVSWRLHSTEDHTGNLICAGSEGVFTPCALKTQHDAHSAMLAGNLLGTHPDDAFLATIALAMIPDCPETFISVYRDSSICRIGLIVKRKLTAVFVLAPADNDAISGHLARLERYLVLQQPGESIASVLCILGDPVPLPNTDTRIISLPPGTLDFARNDPSLLKAAGIALVQTLPESVPSFSGRSPESTGRFSRSLIYAASLALTCLALLGILAVWAANQLTERAIAREHSRYTTIVAQNADIRTMADSNMIMATKILRLNETFFRQTQWTRFMEQLGAMKPSGVFLEQLGTEPVPSNPHVMRVAIAGSASENALVTDFMSRLQKEPLLSDVSLASIENRQNARGQCGFRIFFILKVTRS